MTSTRTEYRIKRIEMLSGMIKSLCSILCHEKRAIEKVNLPEIKKTFETVQKWEKQVIDFQNILPGGKKEQITYSKPKAKTKGMKQADFSEG